MKTCPAAHEDLSGITSSIRTLLQSAVAAQKAPIHSTPVKAGEGLLGGHDRGAPALGDRHHLRWRRTPLLGHRHLQQLACPLGRGELQRNLRNIISEGLKRDSCGNVKD
jgi:hypothetical protein